MGSAPVNVNAFQQLAKQALPKMYYDYVAGGAEDEHTLKENIKAFSRIRIRPRVLVDVSKIDTSITILGFKTSSPILIAPSAFHQLAHPEGEVATARAAAARDTIMVLSYNSMRTIEEVASCCDGVRFFQVYVHWRRDITAQMIQKAERNGFKAIVLTADTPRVGRREADIRNKMIRPQLKNFEGLISIKSFDSDQMLKLADSTRDSSFCWKDINQWLRSVTKLPVLVKGVLTHEDAIQAVEAGVDGIIVSNHGARQLDYTPATITVLEEVVQAVGGRVPVLVDGGVRRGTDVFKAIALGAQAVLIGRPIVFGLAANGQLGVKTILKMLLDEFELSMALAGCPSLKDISRKHVWTEQDGHVSKL